MINLVITLIGPDRPGLVEAVAKAVAAKGGNWLESRMAHLAGKFAGVLQVEVPGDKSAELEAALMGLESIGLKIVIEAGQGAGPAESHPMEVELLGLDRPGLVREISHLLAAQRINVEELHTDYYSAPMTGDGMFRALATVDVPAEVDLKDLRASLERLAGNLMVEIRLLETKRD